MITGKGYAVVSFGELGVATVSETRRGALVNWLATRCRWMATNQTTDDEIERRWTEWKGQDNQCVAVAIQVIQ